MRNRPARPLLSYRVLWRLAGDAKTLRCFLYFAGVIISTTIFADIRIDDDGVFGPDPPVRYGFYTEPSGQIVMARYYFEDYGSSLRIRLANFGRPAVELLVRHYDRSTGELEISWSSQWGWRCQLDQYEQDFFFGHCFDGLHVMPLAIRNRSSIDSEWQGENLSLSAVDLRILDRASQLIARANSRNLRDDRVCDDDIENNQYSVFCAFYAASIEIDGTYRHRRPVMRLIRELFSSRFPDEYEHVLRDINNDDKVTDNEISKTLDFARESLARQLDET